LNHHSTSTVNIQTTEYKKSNFIIVLGYMADSIKLLAVCIFEFKNILRESFSKRIFICINDKG